MNQSTVIYRKRIEEVVEYIDNHLNESLSLENLAKIACFSTFHFHRIFYAIMGETLKQYTNRQRLERSTRLLKFTEVSISNVALEIGFSSPANFSRSFKQYLGMTPKEYKKNSGLKDSKICKDLYPINQHLAAASDFISRNVEVKPFDTRRIAYIMVENSFREGVVLKAYKIMINWAKENRIYEKATLFGMSLDDVMITPKEKYRYQVCMTIPEELEVEHSLMNVKIIPQGQYACTKVSGDINEVTEAYSYLFNHWLINSNYAPEHQHTLEVFLEKEDALDWSYFELELCLPVKPISK